MKEKRPFLLESFLLQQFLVIAEGAVCQCGDFIHIRLSAKVLVQNGIYPEACRLCTSYCIECILEYSSFLQCATHFFHGGQKCLAVLLVHPQLCAGQDAVEIFADIQTV